MNKDNFGHGDSSSLATNTTLMKLMTQFSQNKCHETAEGVSTYFVDHAAKETYRKDAKMRCQLRRLAKHWHYLACSL